MDKKNITDTIFEKAPQVIMVVDRDRRVINLNHEGLDLADKDLEDALGLRGGEALNCAHSWDSIQGCGYGDHCSSCVVRNTVLDSFAKKKNFYKIEANLLLKRQDEYLNFTLLISTVYVSEQNDDDDLVIIYLTNISQQKEIEKQLLEANATKVKLFSIIAHDLKGPFNSMLGFSSLLNESFDDFDTSEQKKFLNTIHNNIKKTYSLLDNLLTWSHAQRGVIEYKPESINLDTLSQEVIEVLKESARDKSIKIINQISKDIIIYADKNMLPAILRNLISNAIKFTPKGGEIILKAHLISNTDKTILITVMDNGIGISEEDQTKLFDLGENTSTQGTESEMGTGLGLIICKELTEKHGGKIWVESEVGKGSAFKIIIPHKE